MKHFLAAVLLTTALALPAAALQSLNTKTNGTVKFTASVTDVTRLTIVGDRIRRVVQDSTQFESINDEETGDVFLRYIGDPDRLMLETGYIITEGGHTVSFELTGKRGLKAETVVITVVGQPNGQIGSDEADEPKEFELAAGQGGDSYSASLVAVVQNAIREKIGLKRPPAVAHGKTVSTLRSNGVAARLMVASGGANGRRVSPEEFYESGVLAVWVEKNQLVAGERAWVISVVKSK